MRSAIALFPLIATIAVHAQVSGDAIVCPGRIYTYTANVPGALVYDWELPVGWYNVSGQFMAAVTATCNVNAGDVCVTAYGTDGLVLGTYCISTEMGGANFGQTVHPASVSGCLGAWLDMVILLTDPTPGCQVCGGVLAPNLDFAIYNDDDASALFLGFIGDVPPPYTDDTVAYVYLIDHTNGTTPAEAIFIEGGCGALENNVVDVTINQIPAIQFEQYPPEVCIGENVEVLELASSLGGSTIGWTDQGTGLEFISPADSNPLYALVTGTGGQLLYEGYHPNGCPAIGYWSIAYCVGTSMEETAHEPFTLVNNGDHRYSISGASTLQQMRVFTSTGACLASAASNTVDLSAHTPGVYLIQAHSRAGDVMRWNVVR